MFHWQSEYARTFLQVEGSYGNRMLVSIYMFSDAAVAVMHLVGLWVNLCAALKLYRCPNRFQNDNVTYTCYAVVVKIDCIPHSQGHGRGRVPCRMYRCPRKIFWCSKQNEARDLKYSITGLTGTFETVATWQQNRRTLAKLRYHDCITLSAV